MDAQALINTLFGVIGAIGGFMLKAMWDAIKSLQVEMSALQASVLANYVRRDDFKDHATRIEAMLVRIEDKLDGKVDK